MCRCRRGPADGVRVHGAPGPIFTIMIIIIIIIIIIIMFYHHSCYHYNYNTNTYIQMCRCEHLKRLRIHYGRFP